MHNYIKSNKLICMHYTLAYQLEFNIIIMLYYYYPGDREVQNVTANQKIDNTGGCLVGITWSLPPNVAEEDVSQYLVYVNGTKLDEPIYMPPAAYRMCSCGSYDISVSTVDRCGRTGQNSSFITVDNSTTLQSRDCGILMTQPTCPENTCTPSDGEKFCFFQEI